MSSVELFADFVAIHCCSKYLGLGGGARIDDKFDIRRQFITIIIIIIFPNEGGEVRCEILLFLSFFVCQSSMCLFSRREYRFFFFFRVHECKPKQQQKHETNNRRKRKKSSTYQTHHQVLAQ